MAFNGSGVFQRLYNWVTDRDNSIKIRADRMDAEMDGFATGLSNCVTKDGQTSITANIPFNTYKATGLGNPTAAQDAATKTYVDSPKDGTHRIVNTSDATKKIAFDASGITTGNTRTISMIDADGTIPTSAQLAKVDYLTVTQGVDLDQMETDIAALANGMVYKGNWDASGGSFPGSGSAQTGWFYTVSVGGTVDSVTFVAGDRLIATTDNASTSTYAANWTQVDATDAVQSVAGLTGSIAASSLRSALNVEDGADVTDAANVNAAGAVMNSDTSTAAMGFVIDEDDMASNSATKVPTQQSVRQRIADAVEVTAINAQTDTAHTLVIGDRGQTVTMDNGSANTLTIPTNASVAFDVGTVVTVIQLGAGVTTITGDTGVTVNGVSAGSGDISDRYGGVSLLKVATDTWIASGAIDEVS